MPKRKQSYAVSSSQIELSQSRDQKTPKRLSLFKSHDKPNKSNQVRSKTKSLADIHYFEKTTKSFYIDSDNIDELCLPSNDVYDQVTGKYNWVRVEDLKKSLCDVNSDATTNSQEEKKEVEIYSVQPNKGPITGNFTVKLEGSNFNTGLSDLTYVRIGNSDCLDATKFVKILSDKEILLKMPTALIPEVVKIHLELFDGSKISCPEEFHYFEDDIDCNEGEVSSSNQFEDHEKYSIMIDHLFDNYDEMAKTPVDDYKQVDSELNFVSNHEDDMMDSDAYQRKFSDYGSQGSLHSDGTSTLIKKIKNLNISKVALSEEVETLKKELSDLKLKYTEMDCETSIEIATLKCRLECRDREIDKLSVTLCNLKSKLLEDGMTKYLERL